VCVLIAQALFSGTELLQTLLVLPLCNTASSLSAPSPRRCLAILSVAMFHIVTACFDQFYVHVLRNQAPWHLWSRDVGLMIVDILYVVMATVWWCQLLKQPRLRGARVSRIELMLAAGFVLLLFVLCLAV